MIQQWPTPETLTDLRGFLGFVQFFNRFIKGFSELARPLKDLKIKNRSIGAWNAECTVTFEKMKEALASAPVLVSSDRNKPFQVDADASQIAVGATNTQLDEEKEPG